MDLKSLATCVEKYAPLLAKVIGSSNPVAGVLVSLIAKSFGASGAINLENVINADPEAAHKLQQLEIEHQDLLISTAVADKESAREREEKIVAITGQRDWVIDTIAIIVICGFFLLCLINYFFRPADDHILIMLIGQASGAFVMVLSYYFGASKT